MSTSYPTRPGSSEDLEFMWEMLYEAAQHSSLSDPLIARYLEGWGRPGDDAVVVLDPENGRRIGAAWYRLMPPDDPGFGFVDASTPEVAIAVVPDHRGVGVGGALLNALKDTARSRGFGALSLSVRRDNSAAIRLYEKSGFTRVDFMEHPERPSRVMKVDLATHDKEESGRTKARDPGKTLATHAPAGPPRSHEKSRE